MLEQAKQFALSFFSFAKGKSIVTLGLVLAAACLEGVGVLLLMPFLELLSNTDAAAAGTAWTKWLVAIGVGSPREQLLTVLGLFLVLIAARNAVLWGRDVNLMELSLGFVDHWRSRLFHALAAAPWLTISSAEHAKFHHTVTNDIMRIALGTQQVMHGAASLVLLVVQLMIAFSLSPVFTLFALLFGAGAMILLIPMTRKARELGENLTISGRDVHYIVGHFLSGIKLAKAQGDETQYVDRFDGRVNDVRSQILHFVQAQTLVRLIVQSTGAIMTCIIIAVGVFMLSTPGSILIVFVIILARLIGPFLTLQQGLQSFFNMLPAFQATTELLATLKPREHARALQPTCVRFESAPTVQFQRVSFGYSRTVSEGGVLSDLTFTIQSGEMVALVGRSGGGKTTLVDVLTGLLRPTMGSVLVAGLPLMGATLHAWRRVLAYVPQEPMLFEDTLRNNLLWANPYRSDPEIWEALRRVCATDVVGLLPEGLDSRIGERGQGLSGGEKQRMCLARALLRRPKILVLDEATSAVDLVGEQQMLTNLRELTPGMTIVAISHRLSSLQNVDRIMVLQDGRIVEEGRWAELASRDGFLRTMMLRDDCTSGAHVGPVNPW